MPKANFFQKIDVDFQGRLFVLQLVQDQERHRGADPRGRGRRLSRRQRLQPTRIRRREVVHEVRGHRRNEAIEQRQIAARFTDGCWRAGLPVYRK